MTSPNRDSVTPEMIQAVRSRECMWAGHVWNVIETYGVGPVSVICSHVARIPG